MNPKFGTPDAPALLVSAHHQVPKTLKATVLVPQRASRMSFCAWMGPGAPHPWWSLRIAPWGTVSPMDSNFEDSQEPESHTKLKRTRVQPG